MTPTHIILAILVVAVWGINFVFIRWGVDEVPPLLLTAVRYFCAAVPLVFFIRRPKVSLRLLVSFGLAIGAFQFGLLFVAIKLGMPAGLASLVIQLQVFFTIGMAILTLGERPAWPQLAGATIAFAGIGLIALDRLEGAALLPVVMTITAALFWGVGNVLTKLAGRIDMLSFIAWSSLAPILPLLLASLVLEGPGTIPLALEQISWRGILSLTFMSYGATIFGYAVWSMLLSRYPANLVAPFALLVPIFGFGSAYLMLGEAITGLEVAGSVLVFAGLLINVFGPRLRPHRTPATDS